MKRIFILFLALALAACTQGNPHMDDSEFSLTEHPWAISGMQSPKGQQELARTHFRDGDDLLVTDMIFSGSTLKMVFPSGAWREVKYTMTGSEITFSESGDPLFYGSPSLGGQDIFRCKYRYETLRNFTFQGINLDGMRTVTFYDPNLSSPDNVNTEKGEWRFNIVEMKEPTNTALYKIEGSYGLNTNTFTYFEGSPAWSSSFIHGEAFFPKETRVDLATIYGGPAWRLPTPEEAEAFLDAFTFHFAHLNNNDRDCVYGENSEGQQVIFYLPANASVTGFWLSGGKAVVISADKELRTASAVISSDTNNKQFLLFPVKK